METCIIQKITSIEEYVELCEIASKLNHHNSSNYSVDKMKKALGQIFNIYKINQR